jgi:Taurine catabolism dioxygenase TauD, TfdA family
MRFSRYGMTGWQEERNPQLPEPTPAQVEAIDAVQFIAAANTLRIALVDGDMLFVNDMALMHARDSFTENGQYLKRHYLKMLFSDPVQSWPVPEYAKIAWDKIYGPNLPDGRRKELWDPTYIPGLEGGESDNG